MMQYDNRGFADIEHKQKKQSRLSSPNTYFIVFLLVLGMLLLVRLF